MSSASLECTYQDEATGEYAVEIQRLTLLFSEKKMTNYMFATMWHVKITIFL